MSFSGRLKLGLVAAACLVEAQRYGENSHTPVVDAPHVAAAFPDVDIDVLSPAFLNPDSVPAGFAELTAPATDQATLGMSMRNVSVLSFTDTPQRRISGVACQPQQLDHIP